MTKNQKTRIRREMEVTNRWWNEKIGLEFKPRIIYDEIKKYLDARQIIALTGLRGVGKTTLMLKIALDYQEKKGVKNVFYFSFDDFKEVRIQEVIDVYAKAMKKDLNKEEYMMLFDEIQKVENWEEQIKRIYDNHRNIKIIVSGSESLFVRKKSKESLAGRCFEFHIKPLKFSEYLHFKNREIEDIELYKDEIVKEFENFILCSGFPELVEENEEFISKYIKENIIEKIIYKDITEIFSIREPAIVEEIFKTILYNPGDMINIDALANDLKISRQTVSIYLDYLEKAFLIKKLYNFSRSMRKTQRKLKKYYPTVLTPEVTNSREIMGKVFETMVVMNLDAEFFWRDAYKNEVDVIKIEKENVIPIEIKYGKIEVNPLKLFMKKFKVKKGMILSYETKDMIKWNESEIEIIPFYEYALKKLS